MGPAVRTASPGPHQRTIHQHPSSVPLLCYHCHPHPACLLTHRLKLAFLFWAAQGAKWPSLSGRDYVSPSVRKGGKVTTRENVPQDTSPPDPHLPLLSLWASQTPVHTRAVKVFHGLASGDGRQQSWGICPQHPQLEMLRGAGVWPRHGGTAELSFSWALQAALTH